MALAVERTNTGVKGLGLIPFYISLWFFVFIQMMVLEVLQGLIFFNPSACCLPEIINMPWQ